MISEIGQSHFELMRSFQGQFISVREHDSDAKFEEIVLNETQADIAQINENIRKLEQMMFDSTI